LAEVVPDDFRQAGRVNRHDIGGIDREILLIDSIRLAWPPKTEAPSVKELDVAIMWVFIMPGQGAPMVGAASLRTVAVGKAVVNAQRVHGPHGLAGLGRVDRQGRSLR